MKLSGQNFQSWAEFGVDIQGLTVLVGPSDKGKSAIFRALKGLLRNELPASFVRNGQDKPLRVTLEHEGKKISAVRKPSGSTKYFIDEKEFSSLGKKIPSSVSDLNMNEVKVGELEIDPIFSSQFTRPFMLDSSPAELNTILGAFASTEKLENGKKQANTTISQRNSDARTLANEIASAEERKNQLTNLIQEGVETREEIEDLVPALERSEKRVFWFKQVTSTLQRLTPLKEIRDSLTIPDTMEAQRLQNQVVYLHRAVAAKRNLTLLQNVSNTIEVWTTLWGQIVALARRSKSLNEAANVGRHLASLDELDTARGLNRLIGEVEQGLNEALLLQSSIKNTGIAAAFSRSIAAKQTELVALEQSITELQQTYNLCPKCGKPLEHICG